MSNNVKLKCFFLKREIIGLLPLKRSLSIYSRHSATCCPFKRSNIQTFEHSNVQTFEHNKTDRSFIIILLLLLHNSFSVGARQDNESDRERSLPSNIEEGFTCHLRTIDLCYAGLLASMQKPLPTTDEEIDIKCEEVQAALDCVITYNSRCSTLQIFGGAMSPIDIYEDTPKGFKFCGNSTDKDSKMLRKKVKELAPCVNERLSSLKRCFSDFQTAVVIFHEPPKPLPTKPLCCALDRFRTCSQDVLDGACGFGSFKEFEAAMMNSMPRVFDTVCRQAKYKTKFCVDILPPTGTPTPVRRGKNASKIGKILSLFSTNSGSK